MKFSFTAYYRYQFQNFFFVVYSFSDRFFSFLFITYILNMNKYFSWLYGNEFAHYLHILRLLRVCRHIWLIVSWHWILFLYLFRAKKTRRRKSKNKTDKMRKAAYTDIAGKFSWMQMKKKMKITRNSILDADWDNSDDDDRNKKSCKNLFLL